ncbi:MAG: LUD domain-containing protein [Anaerolineae bacterium]|jgi:L-lactate dehydrogenase complex protein LldG|nr:LUD domain-containing protein [Anaerolineae bacterium]
MSQSTRFNPVLEAVRRSLGRERNATPAPRPPLPPARTAGSLQAEIAVLLHEIENVAGHSQRLPVDTLDAALQELVRTENIRTATVWNTPTLQRLGIAGKLEQIGVKLVPPNADKHALAQCDLGITEVDFAIPDSGTLGLLSGPEKPRAVSLLPAVHLALLTPAALRPDLHQVFAEAQHHDYLILITGPSRTADIELTLTLGVHGPRELYVWVLEHVEE